MRRLWVSDAEISKLVGVFASTRHIHPVRMVLWRLPRVWRAYRRGRVRHESWRVRWHWFWNILR